MPKDDRYPSQRTVDSWSSRTILLHLAKCPFYWYIVSVKARIRIGGFYVSRGLEAPVPFERELRTDAVIARTDILFRSARGKGSRHPV